MEADDQGQGKTTRVSLFVSEKGWQKTECFRPLFSRLETNQEAVSVLPIFLASFRRNLHSVSAPVDARRFRFLAIAPPPLVLADFAAAIFFATASYLLMLTDAGAGTLFISVALSLMLAKAAAAT